MERLGVESAPCRLGCTILVAVRSRSFSAGLLTLLVAIGLTSCHIPEGCTGHSVQTFEFSLSEHGVGTVYAPSENSTRFRTETEFPTVESAQRFYEYNQTLIGTWDPTHQFNWAFEDVANTALDPAYSQGWFSNATIDGTTVTVWMDPTLDHPDLPPGCEGETQPFQDRINATGARFLKLFRDTLGYTGDGYTMNSGIYDQGPAAFEGTVHIYSITTEPH